ncbi:MAG TPA: LytTR family DNA-binding domain-containing protein [Prolixibacteraceae bacterium]|jgi:DNA-binding LytR/AlgR family response regulator|nr:LytTR family DNA-binding domain-containing protein [Prolixibacteraceae bacterium]
MNVLIVEDEIYAAQGLEKMLRTIEPGLNVLRVIGSVEETIEYLLENPTIDLIFMDIQLSDGISFEIFSETKVEYPVIFTTSYDEYAIKAFQVNSVDYLLKPIEKAALQKSIDKYKKLFATPTQNKQIEQMLAQISFVKKEYKSRLLVKTAKGMLTLPIEEVAYIYIDSQMVFVKTTSNQRFALEKTLDELEKQLDPSKFFRLNRQFIVSVKAINAIHNYFNNTLKIELKPPIDREIIVSRYTVKSFKDWLDS